jgi:6-pyruvoyltetrahydropterin/6-carboxytetrahydropterin synthase
MWKISKQFDFCYAHRVHCQLLNKELSDNAKSKCKFIHGHNGSIKLTILGSTLNEQGMVVDYVNLNWFKNFIDEVLDHKFIVDINDPMNKILLGEWLSVKPLEHILSKDNYKIIDPSWFLQFGNMYQQEYYESFVFVPFVPTSENLSKWLFDIIQKKMYWRIIESVEFCETSKTSSLYIEE